MKKRKQWLFMFLGCFAMLFYLTTDQKTTSLPVISDESKNYVTIVLKDFKDRLIPLSVTSECSEESACLKEAIALMSQDHSGFKASLPKHTELLSYECETVCVASFSKELLEFEPGRRLQIQQALSELFQYNDVLLQVEGSVNHGLLLPKHDSMNQLHLLKKDYSKGNLYQMYLFSDGYYIPVMIHSSLSDPLDVIEQFYGSVASVKLDLFHFQFIDLMEGNPLQLSLSSDALSYDKTLNETVTAVLFSIKRHTDVQSVSVIVDGVIVDEIVLDELILNEIHLSD